MVIAGSALQLVGLVLLVAAAGVAFGVAGALAVAGVAALVVGVAIEWSDDGPDAGGD